MDIFLYLVIFHFVTDFMLQIWGIGTNKKGFNKYMFGHGFITITLPLIYLFFNRLPFNQILNFCAVTFITHLIIDITRQEIHSKYNINPVNRAFWILLGIDQILHTLFIYLGIQWFLS